MAKLDNPATEKYNLKKSGKSILPGMARETNFETLTIREADKLRKRYPKYFELKPKAPTKPKAKKPEADK